MSHRSPTWSPPRGLGASRLPIRVWWDVVEAPGPCGQLVVKAGSTSAAHIDADGRCYRLLQPGSTARSADDWACLSRYLTVHTTDTERHPLISHQQTTGGPGDHWVKPAVWSGSYIACESCLVFDLLAATRYLGRPGWICAVCGDPVWEEQRAWVRAPPSVPATRRDYVSSGGTAFVHETCAHAHDLTAPGPAWEPD